MMEKISLELYSDKNFYFFLAKLLAFSFFLLVTVWLRRKWIQNLVDRIKNIKYASAEEYL